MSKCFPCPACKGGDTEVVTDDGQGLYSPCNYCDDVGMIEINSKRHKEMKHERAAFKALDLFVECDYDLDYDEIIDLGTKIELLTLDYVCHKNGKYICGIR